MSKITWDNKVDLNNYEELERENKWIDDDANETKEVVNEHDDRITDLEDQAAENATGFKTKADAVAAYTAPLDGEPFIIYASTGGSDAGYWFFDSGEVDNVKFDRPFIEKSTNIDDSDPNKVAEISAVRSVVNTNYLFTEIGYYSNTGEYIASNSYKNTGFIKLSDISNVFIDLLGNSALNTVSFFESNDASTYISGLAGSGRQNTIPTYPVNAEYVVFSLINADPTPFLTLTFKVENINPVDVRVSRLYMFTNTGKYYSTSGTLVNSSGFDSTEKIPVAYINNIDLSIYSNGAVSTISFWDELGVFISSETDGGNIINTLPTYPEGTVYVAFSRDNTKVDDSLFYEINPINIPLSGGSSSVYPDNTLYVESTQYDKVYTNNPYASTFTGAPKKRGSRYQFNFKSRQKISGVCLPIVKDMTSAFTDGIDYKIYGSNGFVKEGEILFSELTKYNALTVDSDVNEFDYDVLFDTDETFEIGDSLQLNWMCKSASDLITLMLRYADADEPTTDFYEGGFNKVDTLSKTDFDNLTTFVNFTTRSSYTYACKTFAIDGFTPKTKTSRTMTLPRKVYNVINDVDFEVNANNTATVIYLDHFLQDMKDRVKRELDIKFEETQSNFKVFNPDFVFEDIANGTVNNGNPVETIDEVLTLTGSDIADTEVSLKKVTSLASNGKTTKPIVWVVGNSVSFGQSASLYNKRNNNDNSERYAAQCQEMFLRDYVINGEITGEYECLFVGTKLVEKTVEVEGVSFNIRNCVEAIPGITSAYTDAIKDGSGDFSMVSYLGKYRTMDDDGNRLYFDASQGTTGTGGSLGYDENGDITTFTIGTLVTDVLDYDVCKPTHIINALGFNDTDETVWYNNITKFISDLKAEYSTQGWVEPLMSVAFGDTAGTVFPSLYPQMSPTTTEWDDRCDSRRTKMQGYLKQWMDNNSESNEDTAKVWLLPFFWVLPPAISCGMIKSDLPENRLPYDSKYLERRYGWGSGFGVHVNAIGHANYAYQLYSWLKSTL